MAAHPQFGVIAQPTDLADLEVAIQRSQKMLDLPDNWDDDGGSRISRATWERATTFLRDNAIQLRDERHTHVAVPIISPVGDGSIDIHWKDECRQLLINVPADKEEPIEFFGDDRGHTVVKGTLESSTSTLWLFEWLTK